MNLLDGLCTGIKDELPAPNREIMYAVSSEYHNNGYQRKRQKDWLTICSKKRK